MGKQTDRMPHAIRGRPRVLVAASVASMIDQFNIPNIRLLQAMGCQVHVACNFQKGNTCDEKRVQQLKRALRQMGVCQHQWDCPRKITAPWQWAHAYFQMWHLLGEYPFAWVHCQSPVGGALARLAAHVRKVKVLYTAHGFHFYKGAPWKNWLVYYPVEKLLSFWTDGLVTVNKEDYRFARLHLHAKKTYCIPGVGVDIRKFQAGSSKDHREFCRAFAIPQTARVLLSVGELNAGKNHCMVLKALAGLPQKDVYYLICGQGRMQGKLKQEAKRLGVAQRVRMPGYQTEMPWIYHNADIFVFPSRREGMPVALIEAMAAGLPCVVTDVRGSRELIGPGQGMRIPLGHPQQLKDAIDRLLENKALRQTCSRRNEERAKHYGQAVAMHRMHRIYQEFTKMAAAGQAAANVLER